MNTSRIRRFRAVYLLALIGCWLPQASALEKDDRTHRESQYLLGVHSWYPFGGNAPEHWDATNPAALWGNQLGPYGHWVDRIHDHGWLVHSGLPHEYKSGAQHYAVRFAYEQGMSNIIRVNYRWDNALNGFQTVPRNDDFDGLDAFAEQVCEMITSKETGDFSLGEYAHIYVIGNEMNLPGETVEGQIAPTWYARVFATVAKAIKKVQPHAKVLVAQPASWSDEPEAHFLWSDYYTAMLSILESGYHDSTGDYSQWVDGFAVHVYGYHDVNDTSPYTDSPGTHPEYRDGGFNTFEQIIQWIDDAGFDDKPIYITETNTVEPIDFPRYGEGYPHWYVHALNRIRSWNLNNGHRIRSLVWFLWNEPSQSFPWAQLWQEPGAMPENDMDLANEDFRSVINNLYIQWPGYWAAQNADRSIHGQVEMMVGGGQLIPVTDALVWTDKGNYRTVTTPASWGGGGAYELHVNGAGPYRLYLDYAGTTIDLGSHAFPEIDTALDLTFAPSSGLVQGLVEDVAGMELEGGRLSVAAGDSDRVREDGSYTLVESATAFSADGDRERKKALEAQQSLRVWASLPGYDSDEAVVNVGGPTVHDFQLQRASDNLIDTHSSGNAGFESGLSGWTVSPSGSYVRGGTWQGIEAVGGDQFVGIHENGDGEFAGVLQRTITGLNPGESVRASALVQTRRLNGSSQISGLPLDAKVRLGVRGVGPFQYSPWTESDRLWRPIYSPPAPVTGSGTVEVAIHIELESQSGDIRASSLVAAVDDVYVMPVVSPRIEGAIQTASGQPVAVTVELVEYDTIQPSASVLTMGDFTLTNVLPGAYHLVVHGDLARQRSMDLGFLGPGEVRTGLDLAIQDLQQVDMWHVDVVNVTATSATVEVFTGTPSTVVVAWGTDSTYGQAELGLDAKHQHYFDLQGLSPATTYHFQARAYNGQDVPARSPDRVFVTPSPPAAPQITSLQVIDVTHEDALVEVTTNVPTRLVRTSHGTHPGNWDCENLYICDGTGSTHHLVGLPGPGCGPLTPETFYTFQLQFCDPSSNLTATSGGQFQTDPDPSGCGGSLHISDLQVSEITQGCAAIHWTTDAPANTCIWYEEIWAGPTELCIEQSTTHHEIVLSLPPAEDVTFYVHSSAPGMGRTCSDQDSFSTASSMGQPYTVSGIQLENTIPGEATITFDTSPDAWGFVSYRSQDATPYAQASDGSTGASHQVTLSGLVPGETYSFYANRGLCTWTGVTTPGEQTFVATTGSQVAPLPVPEPPD